MSKFLIPRFYYRFEYNICIRKVFSVLDCFLDKSYGIDSRSVFGSLDDMNLGNWATIGFVYFYMPSPMR